MKPTRKKAKREPRPEPAPPRVPSQPKARPAWLRHVLPILLLWVAVLAAYSNSFQTGLVLDNRPMILEDPRITAATAANVKLILTKEYWYLVPGNGLYRPLTTLSFLVNYAILGNRTNPAGYHLVNYALHAINASLAYLLGWLLFQRRGQAAALAGLWALHPVLTESVTNVVGRADLLAGMAVLGGLLCYIRATMPGSRRPVWLGGAVAALTAGMFSKESAIALLVAVAIYDVVFGARGEWRRRIPVYAVLTLPVLVFLAARHMAVTSVTRFPYTDNPLVGAGFWVGRLTAVKVIGKELGLLLWPAKLSCDYAYNQIPLFQWNLGQWEDWKPFLALAVCAAAAGVAVRAYRSNRPVTFSIAFFFAVLAPTANIAMPIGTIMAERLLYLPALGFMGCLVAAIYQVLRGRAATVAVVVIAAALGARTFARNVDWTDDVSLWASAKAACPNSYRVHLPARIDNRDTAVAEVGQALAILDALPDAQRTAGAYVNAGQIYRLKGDQLAAAHSPESRAWYRKAVDTLQHGRRIETATGTLAKYQLYQELGRAYLRLDEYQNAADAFQQACQRSLLPHLYEELAVAYLKMPDLHQAAVSLMEGLLVERTNRKVASEVADVYRQMDSSGCGKTLDWNCPVVHADMCTASRNMAGRLSRAGFAAEAVETRRKAVAMGCE